MVDEIDDDLDIEETFDEFTKKGNTLGDLWRSNPMIKIGAVVAVVLLIFGAIVLFGGETKPVDKSSVNEASDLKSAPGTEEASPAYVQAVQETNEAVVEQAQTEGGSALPVPVEPPVGVISAPDDAEPAEDPLQRWRRLQEERLQKETQQAEDVPASTEGADTAHAEAVAALSGLMSTQMSSILEKSTENKVQTQTLTDPEFLTKLKEEQDSAKKDISGSDETTGDSAGGELLMPAGEVVYAQILTEANTDSPGPVLGEIMSGPLKGYRILGTFEAQEELLTLNFDTVVIDGKSISIDAVALDPDTTLTGLASDVDHHYLRKIILPAAAAFVQGMSNALAESGRTSITISGQTGTTTTEDVGDTSDKQQVATGFEEAAGKIQETLDDMASKTKTTIKLKAGTPFGLLFVEPVMKESSDSAEIVDVNAEIPSTEPVPSTAPASLKAVAPKEKTAPYLTSSPAYYNTPVKKKK